MFNVQFLKPLRTLQMIVFALLLVACSPKASETKTQDQAVPTTAREPAQSSVTSAQPSADGSAQPTPSPSSANPGFTAASRLVCNWLVQNQYTLGKGYVPRGSELYHPAGSTGQYRNRSEHVIVNGSCATDAEAVAIDMWYADESTDSSGTCTSGFDTTIEFTIPLKPGATDPWWWYRSSSTSYDPYDANNRCKSSSGSGDLHVSDYAVFAAAQLTDGSVKITVNYTDKKTSEPGSVTIVLSNNVHAGPSLHAEFASGGELRMDDLIVQ